MVKQTQGKAFAMDNVRVQVISKDLVALSKKNATLVDVVVSILLSKQTRKLKKDKKLSKFLTNTFENVAKSVHFVSSITDANPSLVTVLALDHPTENIRYQALVLLVKMDDANANITTTGKFQVSIYKR